MAQDKPTLCWKCERACGGCSWSADLIPVDGWDAIPTKIAADRGYYVEKELNREDLRRIFLEIYANPVVTKELLKKEKQTGAILL